MLLVNNRPCNGIEGSRYTGSPKLVSKPDWLKYYGMKACDSGGGWPGVDPTFVANRQNAYDMQVRWRGIYIYLRPGSPANQMSLLTETVGDLIPGEFIFLDWEDIAVSLSEIRFYEIMLKAEYPNRWAMYVNDSSPDMVEWLRVPTCPVLHPNYNDTGYRDAVKFGAAIWQTNGSVPDPSGVFPGKQVSTSYCMLPDLLDVVSGRLFQ